MVFVGTKEEAIKRIENDYSESEPYIDKVLQCFAMWEEIKLGNKIGKRKAA